MKKILIAISSICLAHAGDINILHIAQSEVASIEISTKGKKQSIELEPGSNSGSFTLPSTSATLKLVKPEGDSLKVPGEKTSNIAILYTKKDKLAWHLQAAKPSLGKNALRVLNLTADEQTITFGDADHKIAADKLIDLGTTDKSSLKIKITGAKSKSISPEEPCAHLAVLYTSAEGTKVAYIQEP